MGKISVLENTRIISLGHFSIIYKLQDNLIFIMAFWDNRQDPEILLSNLKKKYYKLFNKSASCPVRFLREYCCKPIGCDCKLPCWYCSK